MEHIEPQVVIELDGALPVELQATSTTFEQFCAEHADRLTRALALALNNSELGRDAAAEGLTRAWPRWHTVSTYANPAGWVYRVGLNWGRSRLRRRRREVSPIFMPEAATHDEHVDQAVRTAMAQLSDEHRAVVVGRYYLDWSEADVAAALNIPPGTVKSRLSRALAQLESHLPPPNGGPHV